MPRNWSSPTAPMASTLPIRIREGFADTTSVAVDEQKLSEAVEAKVNELYGGVHEIDGWEIKYKTLTKTEDGKTALRIVVNVDWKVQLAEVSGDVCSGESLTFLVPLEE